ncbi:M61 family metallopeptidase [Chitinilyticum aquatile]|uniref:M61 family metallopeptidase n=1 Tax=Chitinilyticum aquatile TaxID=362520 RepID=UPI0004046166|nr:PDZ domain-containing protein [Chitinilyticum aquatile]
MLQYTLSISEPHSHLFDVELNIPDPDPSGQILVLPVWIPGSYLIREFARHVVSIAAFAGDEPVVLAKLDKHRWQVAPLPDSLPLRVVYRVYAFDLSVRGAYLDQFRGFFNGTSVFLAVEGQESIPCQLDIVLPAVLAHWRVATGLPRLAADGSRFLADNYDALIDHPVELGDFRRLQFLAAGVPHHFVLAGRHRVDESRLIEDARKICEYQIAFWGEPAPFADYHFLTMATGDGYGGLEHRNSTALLCSRDDLPLAHETARKAGYRQFLGLVSHEYFHTWLVKRIKPAEFVPYRLDRENYTRQLWLFEGVTSYYDDLVLVRTGLLSVQEYLNQLAQTITAVRRNPGSRVQTLEEASLDAWVKYYRQDENSPNALASYYAKGALVALCTDLLIRKHSQGRQSLDDVMRALWRLYGKPGLGVPDGEFERLATELASANLSGFFDLALRSGAELPLQELLESEGVEWQQRPAASAKDKGGWLDLPVPGSRGMGARYEAAPEGVRITHVLSASPAERAGLAAGDVLVAAAGLRVTPDKLDAMLAANQGEALHLHAFRRDELIESHLEPCFMPANHVGLRLKPSISAPDFMTGG